MKNWQSSLSFIDSISEWVGKIVRWAAVFLVVTILIEIVSRELLHPTIWAHELCAMVYGGYAILSGVYALRHRTHIRVDILLIRVSRRVRAILDLWAAVFFFAFSIVILRYGGELAWESFLLRERADTTWAPLLYPYYMVIALGGFLISIQGVANFIRDLKVAATGKDIE